jgi:hypothetical protein
MNEVALAVAETDPVEYRGYVFVNRALSSIQKGVQGTHATVEMFNNFILTGAPKEGLGARASYALDEWTKNHKTLVYVDCGFHQEILDFYEEAKSFCAPMGLPHALFREDEWTMNCMATAFAIIVPSTIYDYDIEEFDAMSKWVDIAVEPMNVQFYRFLRRFKLAI